MEPCVLYSPKRRLEIRKPLRTKNRSTPSQPILAQVGLAWTCTPSTSKMANPRKLSNPRFRSIGLPSEPSAEAGQNFIPPKTQSQQDLCQIAGATNANR